MNISFNNNDYNISFFGYILYGLPSSALAAAQMIVYISIPPIYAIMPDVGLALVGMAIMFTRFFDMITDPIMGNYLDVLISKIGWAPWFIFSWPLLSIGIYILLNPFDGLGFISLIIGLTSVTLGWTLFTLPWWSMGIIISKNSNVRLKVASIREAFAIPGIIIGGSIIFLFEKSGLMYAIFAFVLLSPLFLRKVPTPKVGIRNNQSYFSLIKLAFNNNNNFKYLIISYFFIGLSNGITSILFVLYVNFIVGGQAYIYLLIYFISAFAGLPIIVYLGIHFGKKNVWISSMILTCLFFTPVFFINYGDNLIFSIICILTGICLSADLSMPSAIQADIITKSQEREKQNISGRYYSIWSLSQKLALALSAGITLPLITFLGFNPNIDGSNLYVLSASYGLLPIILKVPAIFVSSYIKD